MTYLRLGKPFIAQFFAYKLPCFALCEREFEVADDENICHTELFSLASLNSCTNTMGNLFPVYRS